LFLRYNISYMESWSLTIMTNASACFLSINSIPADIYSDSTFRAVNDLPLLPLSSTSTTIFLALLLEVPDSDSRGVRLARVYST